MVVPHPTLACGEPCLLGKRYIVHHLNYAIVKLHVHTIMYTLFCMYKMYFVHVQCICCILVHASVPKLHCTCTCKSKIHVHVLKQFTCAWIYLLHRTNMYKTYVIGPNLFNDFIKWFVVHWIVVDLSTCRILIYKCVTLKLFQLGSFLSGLAYCFALIIYLIHLDSKYKLLNQILLNFNYFKSFPISENNHLLSARWTGRILITVSSYCYKTARSLQNNKTIHFHKKKTFNFGKKKRKKAGKLPGESSLAETLYIYMWIECFETHSAASVLFVTKMSLTLTIYMYNVRSDRLQ